MISDGIAWGPETARSRARKEEIGAFSLFLRSGCAIGLSKKSSVREAFT
jgi:hypothetical protein